MKMIAVLLSFFCLAANAQEPLNIMTFNIRLDTPRDSANAWPFRKDRAASQILFHGTHILGVQEALHNQMEDLSARLPGFRYTGVARDDGKQKGEYSAIFYNSGRLTLLAGETFWLSPEPAVPGSKGWDAAITRIVSWAKFRDSKTKKVFFVFNTHFDHMGKLARAESARLLLKKVHEIAGRTPAIIMGDFNASPDQEPILILTDLNDPLHLVNTLLISKQPHYGPTGTFNGFQSKETSDQPIDHIFIKGRITVMQHATLSQTWQGKFSSDHFPVFARVIL